MATGFNTAAMKQMNHGMQGGGPQGGGPQGDHPGPHGPQGDHPGPQGPQHRRRRNAMGPPQPSPPSSTLHGVFQLASHQACDDGVTPSANICGMPCSSEWNFVFVLQ